MFAAAGADVSAVAVALSEDTGSIRVSELAFGGASERASRLYFPIIHDSIFPQQPILELNSGKFTRVFENRRTRC